MDNTYASSPDGGHTTLSRVLLLLFLTGLQPALCSQTEPPNSLTVEIIGPNYVTVGVPSSIVCSSNCPECTYSMSLDGQTAQGQGNELAFTVKSWTEALTVKCTVTEENNETIKTAEKKIQVLAGPANVSITGPDLMNPSVSHTYSCHAYCRPSCNYTWRADKGPWIRGQGNVISVTPQETEISKSLTCKATNSVSGLYVTATRNLAVMRMDNKSTRPGETLVLLLFAFILSAAFAL